MNFILFHGMYEHQKADAEIYKQADGDINGAPTLEWQEHDQRL
jgi:hypothetical protein